MNVPPSRKAKVFVVTEDADLTKIFENSRVFFSTLASANEVVIQKIRQESARMPYPQ